MLLVSMVVVLRGQTIEVRDESNQEPIAGVIIHGSKSGKTVETNVQGQADLTGFIPEDTILVQMVGFDLESMDLKQLEADGFVVYLHENRLLLDEVVVSVSRWQQKKREIPTKITTIPARDIQFGNPQTAADLLAQSGDVFMQKSQLGGGSPMIRGFATNRVVLSVDGIRMNNAIFRSGNLQNVINIDPFTLQSAEISFGPSSVLFGSDAIGGVMSFYTLKPELAASGKSLIAGNVDVRYSSANSEKTGHADLMIGGKKWGMVTSATWNNYGDLRQGSRGPEAYLRPEYVVREGMEDVVVANPDPLVQIPSGFSQLQLMQKIRFKASDAWDFEYGGHYATTSDYSRYDRLIRYRRGTLRSGEWSYGPQTWMMHRLSASYEGGLALLDDLQLSVAYQYFAESRKDRDLNDAIRHVREENVDAWSFQADATKAIGKRHQLQYGAEWIWNGVTSLGSEVNVLNKTEEAGPSRYPDGSTWRSLGLYATHRYQMQENWVLRSGLRYSDYGIEGMLDTRFYPFPVTDIHNQSGALTGSIGVVFNPTPTWQLFSNLSTGFRAPNIDDVGKVFDSEPGSVVLPNPSLKSEYLYSVDVGTAAVIGSFLKVDLTAYYNYLNGAMVRRDSRFNGQDSILYDGELSQVQTIQNAAQATVYGIQVGAEADLGTGWSLLGHVNYQKGEEELDDGSIAPLRHAAPLFGVARLRYERKQFRAELYSEFNSEVSNANLAPSEQDKDYLYAPDADGNPYTPAWMTLNLKASYSFAHHIVIQAGLENIFDKRYRPYSSGISAAGRNLILAVRWRF